MALALDGFNRADSTSLGADWTEVVGQWEIVSNRLQCGTDAGATGYYLRHSTDVGSADMYAQAVVTSTQVNASSNTGIAARMRAAANTSYQLTTRHAGDTCSFWRVVAGAETQITSTTGAAAVTAVIASGDTIRIETVGTVLRGKVNSTLVALATDGNITDGQRGGVNGYNNVNTDVVEVDLFEAGALTDSPPGGPYISGWTAQAQGTGTTLTPTLPANLAAGDLVCAWSTTRNAADTLGPPAGEGWSTIQAPSQTGLKSALTAKVWGLGGQTDDTTPTFTNSAGTNGWGVTVFVIRNPAHGTTPWTSVATAIVASGSQSNVAAATAQSPSVSATGTHQTVVRCYDSADDNALNVTSAGVMVFGGAAYDQTTGDDYAQACTILEDTTLGGSTGTATVNETAVGNDVSNGVTLVVSMPSAATVNATMAAELGAAAAATVTVEHPATMTAGLGPTGTVTATRTTFTAPLSDLGGTATMAAARVVAVTAAASLGALAVTAATPDHPATVAADLGAAAAVTATVTHPVTSAAALGGAAATAAVRDTALIAAGALGALSALSATPIHFVAASAALGAAAAATAVVAHPAVADAPLGCTATATATVPGGPVSAVIDAQLGGTAAAAVTVTRPVALTSSLGGTAIATATPHHPVIAAADLGAAAATTAVVMHPTTLAALLGADVQAAVVVGHHAVVVADLGFTATAVAAVPLLVRGVIRSAGPPWPAGTIDDPDAVTAAGAVGGQGTGPAGALDGPPLPSAVGQITTR